MFFRALKNRFSYLIESLGRYPVTVLFLLAAAVLTAIVIVNGSDLTRYTLTCAIGAVSSAAAQSCYERFFRGIRWRILLYVVSVLLTLLFALSIWRLSQHNMEMAVRTAVTALALFITFIWIAVIKSKYTFSDSFMAAFKALFQALFFSGIIFLGCAAIISAVDLLITAVDEDAYAHTANVVFVLIAPLFFLSLIPVYPGRGADDAGREAQDAMHELVEKRTSCPKFLEVLLSYIIVPLTTIFTVILLVYIAINIGGEFWTNNLLEPLLVSYSITVIVVTLLVSRLENKFAVLFTRIFPKLLIPIALFQVIASVLLTGDSGVTPSRYYVILYGAFAVLAGGAFSLRTSRRSSIVAILLIALSAVSLIPPADAFSVSRNTQISSLEFVLTKNGMLSNNTVHPSTTLSDADKAKIVSSVMYLSAAEELGRVQWLPDNFNAYDDTMFFNTFGFHQYVPGNPEFRYVSVYFNPSEPISITGYDVFTQITIPNPEKSGTIEIDGKTLVLSTTLTNGSYILAVKDGSGTEIARFDMNEIMIRYAGFPSDKTVLTREEATFAAENENLALRIVVQNAGYQVPADSMDMFMQLLVFIKVK